MRSVLIDKQGNFGSIAGLPPAAMRYTEARMSTVAAMMLEDLKLDTVDFIPTYDERGTEPVVLPSKFPNLLVNGSGGIAVGMATSIPPHNLKEVCGGVIALIDNPDVSIMELASHIQGPDFPTGGIICGKSGILRGYQTGPQHDHRPRADQHRRSRQQNPHHHSRNPLPAGPRPRRRTHCGAGERGQDCWDFECSQRKRPERAGSPGDRPQARRRSRRGAESALQVLAAARHVQRDFPRTGRWQAAGAEPQGNAAGILAAPGDRSFAGGPSSCWLVHAGESTRCRVCCSRMPTSTKSSALFGLPKRSRKPNRH